MSNAIIRRLGRFQASIAKRLFWRQHLAEARTELQRLKREFPTVEMLMTVPCLFHGKGYYRSMELKQNMGELLGLVNLLRTRKLDRVCEIGTFKGGTLFLWCQMASPSARIISIDLPGGKFGGGYNERCLPFFQAFCHPGQQLHCLRGDSHAAAIQADFRETMGDDGLDFLFIDGDHSYDGVKQDFDFYSRFVKPGGVIALHDIHHREAQPDIEVHKWWNEAKSGYRHEEFVEDSAERRKIGIGVIYKD